MYIYDFFNHIEKIEKKASDKKLLLTKKFNRTDNFINLALYGAQKCINTRVLTKESNIYLASRNGNMNTTFKVLDAIFLQNKLPMPFNFLNSVNAAKLFYIAKSFQIEGKTLFVDRFESALPQAFVDVQNRKTVLLGTVNEVITDLTVHQERFGIGSTEEESRWLLLSQTINTKEALAKISDIQFGNNGKKNAITNLFNFLEEANLGDNFHFQGDNLSFNVKKLKSKRS
jgi:hypothetical protein